jgi:hypothetical protein
LDGVDGGSARSDGDCTASEGAFVVTMQQYAAVVPEIEAIASANPRPVPAIEAHTRQEMRRTRTPRKMRLKTFSA